jgi:hypothetical protein
MTTAQYMSSNYDDALGFLLEGVRAQNYTVKIMENYYNLSGCDVVLSFRLDTEQSTSDAIRNFVCSGGKLFVLWSEDAGLINEFGMNFTDTKGLPIFSVYSQHPAAKGVSKIYIPGQNGFTGGDAVITRSGTAVIAEKSCNTGKVIFSASNAFDNTNMKRFDNGKLALQIVKYLANDDSSVVIPSFPEPDENTVMFFNSVGSVGDALSTISKDPVSKGKIVLAWWDFGKTIESHDMKVIADSASLSTLTTLNFWYTEVPAPLRQQVAADLGTNLSSDDAIKDLATLHATTNETEAIDVIRRNNASYIMFSSYLEDRFNSISYLYCYFNNETEESSIGSSQCERQLEREMIVVEKNFETCNVSGKVLVKAASMYNVMAGVKTYCIDLGGPLSPFSNDSSSSNSMALYDSNGKKIDTIGIKPADYSYGGNYYFYIYYPSSSPDRKGKFYDTIFYQGLYETLPASMNATLVYDKTIDGMLTRVYKIN